MSEIKDYAVYSVVSPFDDSPTFWATRTSPEAAEEAYIRVTGGCWQEGDGELRPVTLRFGRDIPWPPAKGIFAFAIRCYLVVDPRGEPDLATISPGPIMAGDQYQKIYGVRPPRKWRRMPGMLMVPKRDAIGVAPSPGERAS